jgi:excisionase family DNA binding protein
MDGILERGQFLVPSKIDSELAKTASRTLARAKDQAVKISLSDGKELELPRAMTEFLVRILTELSNGNMVDIVPIHAELTTQEAANHLNVSRPYLIKLLEQGEIPYHKVGSHRRIKFEALRSFMVAHEAQREGAMTEMAQLSQEFDVGY